MRDLPPADARGNRTYGLNAISLKKRAASNGGWQTIAYHCRGKQVWGAGSQQVRNLWSNIACWNLDLWIDALVELC